MKVTGGERAREWLRARDLLSEDVELHLLTLASKDVQAALDDPEADAYRKALAQQASRLGGLYWKSRVRLRLVRRTPFGENIVRAYNEELRSGTPIRWGEMEGRLRRLRG